MYVTNAFVAYTATPDSIGQPIELAAINIRTRSNHSVTTWKHIDVCGHFIADQVLNKIEDSALLVADITKLNFNVIYEVGYAIGRGKPILVIRNNSLNVEDIPLSTLGIFDTLGYESYNNADDLTLLLMSEHDLSPINVPLGLNSRAPIYTVEPRFKTDFITRTISRVNKGGLHQRKFDPNEQSRLAAFDAIENVAESYGIVIPLLAHEVQDSRVHNLRSAFVAGLAEGLGKLRLILQEGDSPVPIDYRDITRSCYHLDQIDGYVADFAASVTELFQAPIAAKADVPENLLQTIHLGASTAENELRDLPGYYLETEEFMRVARGEARVVVGRKGAGKTALFYRVRDRVARNRNHVVLDLKPEGYQFRKLRDSVLSLLQEGSQDHLVTAFWEYLLLLEICNKLLEMDRERQLRDPTLSRLYRQIEDQYGADRYIAEGDFSDRLHELAMELTGRYTETFGLQAGRSLSEGDVTNLLYRHDLGRLKRTLKEYLALKDEVWMLIDNIDKGWPSSGIEQEDVLIIRTLLEATRKIERDFSRSSIDAHTIVFLRNDVYDLLVDQTADRGKEAKIAVDWTDSDLLKEMIRLRLVYSGLSEDLDANSAWRMICTPLVKGEESFQYLIDRCLMRPRALIDLINHCRSIAVNLRHEKIQESDVTKGLEAFSNDLVTDINLEMRDVMPEANDLLYHFIGGSKTISLNDLERLLIKDGRPPEQIVNLFHVLYWHGVLGMVWPADGRVEYVYQIKHNMRLFAAQIEKLQKAGGVILQVNPAFWPALGVQ